MNGELAAAEAEAALQAEELEFRADDGARLQLYRWRPQQAVKASLLIVHGISEHGGRYDEMAARLAAQGYAVYAHDQPGHGRTAPDRSALGFVAARGGWRQLLGDIDALLRFIADEQPRSPRFLFGHSMGSFLAQHYAIESGARLSGLILTGSDHRTDPLPRLGQVLADAIIVAQGPTHRSQLLDYLSTGLLQFGLKGRRNRFDWLNRDPREVDRYIADPYCGITPAVSLWRDVYQGLRFISRRRHQARLPQRLPILLLAGTADQLSRGGRRVRQLAQAYRRQGLEQVELRLYPGARHELHRELNREEVFADLGGWLERQVSAQP
jgi:alpha-beta hydrolase superfamily lysophospholipase